MPNDLFDLTDILEGTIDEDIYTKDEDTSKGDEKPNTNSGVKSAEEDGKEGAQSVEDAEKKDKQNKAAREYEVELGGNERPSVSDLEKEYLAEKERLAQKDNKSKDTDKDEEDEKETSKSDDNTDSANETIKLFAQGLIDTGVLEGVEEDKINELKNFDSLKDLIQETIKSREYGDLNEDQKEYLEAIRAGVTHEAVTKYQNVMSSLNNIKDEDIAEDNTLSQKIYATYLKQKGFDDDKVAKFVKRSVDSESIEEDAKESLAELKEIQRAKFNDYQNDLKDKQKELEQRRIDNDKNLKKLLTKDKPEFIKGSPVTSDEGKEIYESITRPVAKDANGTPLNEVQKFAMENPVEYKARLHYLYKKGFFTDNADLSSVEKRTKSEAVKKLNSMFESGTTLNGGKSASKPLEEDEVLDQIMSAL